MRPTRYYCSAYRQMVIGRCGALDWDPRRGGPPQFHFVSISLIDHQADGETVHLSKQATSHALLDETHQMMSEFFPRRVALWSTPYPYSTSPGQAPSLRRRVRPQSNGALLTRLPPPTSETDGERWPWHITRWDSAPPGDYPSAVHISWYRRSADPARGALRPRNDVNSHAWPRAIPSYCASHPRCGFPLAFVYSMHAPGFEARRSFASASHNTRIRIGSALKETNQ